MHRFANEIDKMRQRVQVRDASSDFHDGFHRAVSDYFRRATGERMLSAFSDFARPTVAEWESVAAATQACLLYGREA